MRSSCTATASLSPSRPWRGSRSLRSRPPRRRNTIRAPPTPRSRSATPTPTAARPRPTALIGKTHRRLLQDGQRPGRHQRPQDQLHLLRRRLQPAEDGRAGAQAGREDEVLLIFQTLGTPSNTAIQQVHEREEGAAALRRHRRDQVGRPEELPLDHGLAAELPDRRADLRQVHPARTHPNAKIGVLYQNDDYGKDYLKGLKDGLGDKAKTMIVAEAPYEVDRPDRRFADRPACKASGADVFFNITTPKFAAQAIKQGGRDRLEAGALPEQRLALGRLGAEAGRARERQGRPDRRCYLKDPTDPQWKDDAGDEGVARLHGQVLSPTATRPSSFNVYGYAVAADPGAGAQAVRRRPHARERHAAGREPEGLRRSPMLLPGIKINTSPTDFYPDRADADAALQRRALGTVRRGDERRGRRVAALSPGGL